MGVKVSGRGGTLLCVNYEHIDPVQEYCYLKGMKNACPL